MESNSSVLTQGDTLTFLSEICGILKQIKRKGWVLQKVPLPESDSDHMHRCAMCTLIVTSQPPDPRDDYSTAENKKFHPSNINDAKLLRMALTHDLCESIAGDITPHCDPKVVASKHEVEQRAMEKIRSIVGDPLGKELFDYWKEYEEQVTVEALYCKDIDKFEMVMQAYEYEKMYLKNKQDANNNVMEIESPVDKKSDTVDEILEPLRGFFQSTNNAMKSPLFRRLDKELRERREKLLKERGWDVSDEEKQNY